MPDHAGVLRSFPVLVMVAAYSRFISAVMSRHGSLGAVGRDVDNCCSAASAPFLEHRCGVTSPVSVSVAAWRKEYRDFAGCLGTRLIKLDPMTPRPRVWCSGSTATAERHFCRRLVANHERLWGANGLASDPAHVSAASVLRRSPVMGRS